MDCFGEFLLNGLSADVAAINVQAFLLAGGRGAGEQFFRMAALYRYCCAGKDAAVRLGGDDSFSIFVYN